MPKNLVLYNRHLSIVAFDTIAAIWALIAPYSTKGLKRFFLMIAIDRSVYYVVFPDEASHAARA